MNDKNKKMNIIQYSKSMDKNLKLISKNKKLKDLLQEMNNVNNDILKYNQIKNLLKYITESDFDIKVCENIFVKDLLLDDMKLLQKKLYKSKKLVKNDNNIKIYKNNVKDVIQDIFGIETKTIKKYYTKSKIKLIKKKDINNHSSCKNICETERNINSYKEKKNIYRNNTIENDKDINNNCLTNCVKFKHPQFYLLNTNNTNKKYLPPIKVKKVKMVDLNKNNNHFTEMNKRSKFEKYMIAMQLAGIAKFKVNELVTIEFLYYYS